MHLATHYAKFALKMAIDKPKPGRQSRWLGVLAGRGGLRYYEGIMRDGMRFLPLLFTVFVDSLGFGLVFPIFFPLVIHNETGLVPDEMSLAARGLIVGCLISSFCLGQFFSGPAFGAWSDRRGRKKILILTLWLAVASYLLAGCAILASSLTLLFASRLLGGAAAGNYAIAQSIVADQSDETNKAKNFGLIGMAYGTGFILGPFLGGKLSGDLYPVTTPFWVAAGVCLFNIMLVHWKLRETLPALQFKNASLMAPVHNLRKAFQHPTLRGVFLVMFLFSLGWGFFTEFSPLFLISYFNFDRGNIGNFYACVGLWVAVCQGVLIRPCLKRFSAPALLHIGLLCLGIVLPLTLVVGSATGLYWVLPFLAFFESLVYPTASTIVSNKSGPDVQGEMLGIHNSVQWAAIGVSPLFSGSLVALYPHLPVSVASVCMFLAFSLLLFLFRRKRTLPTQDA
jgi:DHA1 family tetracycline resistance protein-like MFS transporter